MAGRPATLRVDILADAKKVGPGVNEAESKFSKLGGTLAKVGKIAAVGLAAGLGAAAAGAFKLAQGAAEDEAAAAQLANTLRQATGATDKHVAATERWITKQGAALGVADDELRPAIARLAAATGDLSEAQDLAALSMDVAAGTGKSLEQVTEAMAKAANGSVGGLGRLGVATKDAAGNTLSLEQITDKLAKTYKGSASTAANTAAGRFGRLKLQMGELGETVGGKLLPIGNKLAGWALDKMLPAATKLGGRLAKNLGPAFQAVGSFITKRAVPAVRDIHSWFVDKIVPGLQRYVTPILDGVRSMFGKLSDAVERNREPLAKIGNAMREVAEFIADKVLPIVGKLIGEGFEALGTVIGTVIDAIGTLVGWLDTAIDKMGQLVDWVGKIDMPDLKLPGFLGGSVGNLTVTGVRLVGVGPSYDQRRGFTSAAAGAWSAVSSASRDQLAPGSYTVVDARTYVDVDNRAGLADEAELARKLDRILREHAARLGRTSSFAAVTP